MKARPILMSAPMVRAILAGTKTQTRRVVKPVGDDDGFVLLDHGNGYWPYRSDDGESSFHTVTRGGKQYLDETPHAGPYGQPGDRLWVKETWRTAKSLDEMSPSKIGETCTDAGYRKPWAPIDYAADGYRNSEWRGFEMAGDAEPGKTRVSIHMPRWASRILLDVVSVRVERLRDITPADCVEEGYESDPSIPYQPEELAAIDWYRRLWESLNGAGSWAANPWVWCISFRRIKP